MKLVVDELYRARMLMTGVYVGLAISSTYGFSIFTEHLRNKYGFNQVDITTISTVGNCCGYLVFFAGILFDFAGPKVLFPVAGSFGFIGYLLFGLAFNDVIKSSSTTVALVQFSIFNAILYFGCPAMDVATLMPLMVNYPLERGYMVIIQKTFSGLGTSVLMAYFNGWFRDMTAKDNSNYAGYAYFMGSQILFCSLLGCYFVDLAPYTPCQYRKNRLTAEAAAERQATLAVYGAQHAPKRRLYIGCALVGANLVFLAVSSIVTGYVPTNKSGYVAISVVAVVLLALFSLMALPLQFLGRYPVIAKRHPHFPSLGYSYETAEESEAEAQTRRAELMDVDAAEGKSSGATQPAQREPTATATAAAERRCGGDTTSSAIEADVDALVDKGVEATMTAQEPSAEDEAQAAATPAPQTNVSGDPQYRQSFWRNLLTVDLWLFWLSFFGMWGTGTVMQMNAAQIYRSKNLGVYDQSRLALYVALIGVGSAIGRIISGVLDMWLLRRKAHAAKEILTTTFFPIGAALLFLSYLFFAVIPVQGLILPFLLGSIGTGMGWGLGALSVRIVYANDIGKHYNFMFSSGFVSTIVLNRFMFGGMFDNEASRLHTAPSCNQPSCVRNQMFILMAVNALSCAAAVFVHLRFRRFVRVERAKQAALAVAATTTTVEPSHTNDKNSSPVEAQRAEEEEEETARR
ncbi:Nodulin-like [Novymonas esmeraldas]|uniref:Nodulin-like n=1 Tax=Novymonas esmeraldas TaxID=1808958 RepID=A0AAW0F386_9TRYP